MQPNIHFYDAQLIGAPASGQLVSFDSLLCSQEGVSSYSTAIALRPDVAFNPAQVGSLDCFDLDLESGVPEYEWSRTAQTLFRRPGTLHIGMGNTSQLDSHIRYAFYRCLSTLPNTGLTSGSHYLDLLTLSRAIAALRPDSFEANMPVGWTEQKRRDYALNRWPSDSRAACVMSFAIEVSKAAPKMLGHAIGHSSPWQIANLMGLTHGRVDSLDALQPVFVCHETLCSDSRTGVYLCLGTDSSYSNIVYLVDLTCDLRSLIDDSGAGLSRFMRTEQGHRDRPLIRMNLNRVPFVCGLNVIDRDTAGRLGLDMSLIRHNVSLLRSQPELCLSVLEFSGATSAQSSADADYQLFGGEYLEPDRKLLNRLHEVEPVEWDGLLAAANDTRIRALARRLYSRGNAGLLANGEADAWRKHCAGRLLGRTPPESIKGLKDYCEKVAGSEEYPVGMRTAAKHWLRTTENCKNEQHSNI